MLKLFIFLIILLSFIKPSFASERTPLVVLMEKDPFLRTMGVNSATFALYDDGLVIFRKEKDTYLSMKLSKKEKNDFISSLSIDENLKEFEKYCEAVTIDDKVDNMIYFFHGKDVRKAQLFSNLRSDEKARKNAPKSFLNMYDKIISYDNPKAADWKPVKFQVILWPFGDTEGSPWPEGWPDLKSSDTVKKGDSYSIYLDFKYFEVFKKLIKESSSVIVNGKIFHTFYRFPFPCEEKWI